MGLFNFSYISLQSKKNTWSQNEKFSRSSGEDYQLFGQDSLREPAILRVTWGKWDTLAAARPQMVPVLLTLQTLEQGTL